MFEEEVAKSLETANQAMEIAVKKISYLERQVQALIAERDRLAIAVTHLGDAVNLLKQNSNGRS